MADLKNPPDEKSVYAAAEKAIQAVRSAADATISDIQEVTKALRALPDRSSDLLTQAEVAWAAEFQLENDLELYFVQLTLGSFSLDLQKNNYHRPVVKGGKRWRVVVVVLPVKT